MSEKRNVKVIRINRNKTCLDIFDFSEIKYACDKHKKYLDSLSNSKKRIGGSYDQL